jgi:hypothetical protein
VLPASEQLAVCCLLASSWLYTEQLGIYLTPPLCTSHEMSVNAKGAHFTCVTNTELVQILTPPNAKVSEARPSHWLAQDDTARCTLETKRCGGSAVAVVAAAGIARAGIGGGMLTYADVC